MNSDYSTLREVLHRSFSRYIRVRPSGLELRPGQTVESICARILTFKPARTLYRNKKPVCRSLDGIQALSEGRTCASCLLRKTCTPQVYIELLHEDVPLRLLLAYTSARNFLAFVSSLREKAQTVEGIEVFIFVRDRGRWGEVCFLLPTNRPT